MKKRYNILVTDRNPHVRELLKREMEAEGYYVRVARSGQEVLKWIYHHESLDLLILDPDLVDIDKLSVFKKIKARTPSLPVVIHMFSSDDTGFEYLFQNAVFVEKNESSVERLKEVVSDVLFQEAETEKTTMEIKTPGHEESDQTS